MERYQSHNSKTIFIDWGCLYARNRTLHLPRPQNVKQEVVEFQTNTEVNESSRLQLLPSLVAVAGTVLSRDNIGAFIMPAGIMVMLQLAILPLCCPTHDGYHCSPHFQDISSIKICELYAWVDTSAQKMTGARKILTKVSPLTWECCVGNVAETFMSNNFWGSEAPAVFASQWSCWHFYILPTSIFRLNYMFYIVLFTFYFSYCTFNITLFNCRFHIAHLIWPFSCCPFLVAFFTLLISHFPLHIPHFTFYFSHSSFHIALLIYSFLHCAFHIILFTWLCSLTGYTYQEWRHRSRFSEREEQADSSDGEGGKGSGRSKGHQMSGGRFTVTGTKRRNCEYIQNMASFIECVVHCSVHKVDYQILYSSIIDLTLVLPTDT